jgi:hypothetical protein
LRLYPGFILSSRGTNIPIVFDDLLQCAYCWCAKG